MIHLLALLSTVAAAEEKKDAPKPEVEVGAMLFGHHAYSLTDGADGYNEFGLDRTYVNVKAKITPRIGARYTLDSDRLAGLVVGTDTLTVDSKMRVFTKFAYLEGKDFVPGMKVRIGMIDTPFLQVYDNFWEHRYISKGMTDDQKLLSPADYGVALYGTHAGGLVDWQAGVYNGEGFAGAEVDAGKSIQARITVDPLAKGGKQNLPIVAFVNDNMHPDADSRLTYIGGAGYKMPFVWVWGEYVGVSEGDVSGSGFSASVLPGMPKYARLILRYDHFDPNADVDKDGTDKIIAGVSHNFADKVSAAATYERVTLESLPDTPAHGVYLHWQAGF